MYVILEYDAVPKGNACMLASDFCTVKVQFWSLEQRKLFYKQVLKILFYLDTSLNMHNFSNKVPLFWIRLIRDDVEKICYRGVDYQLIPGLKSLENEYHK